MQAPRHRNALRLLLALSLLAGTGGNAFAQSGDPAAAEALFAAGRVAFDAGDYDSACAKFAESHRLDPAAGTVINLAACNERRGRLASAWENWREALSLLRVDDDRRPGVEKRKADLEPRVPRLVVRLAPGAPTNAQVSRDGIALGPAALGLPLPIDPGAHRVEVTLAGRAPKIYDVNAEESRVTELAVEPGVPLPEARAAGAAPTTPAPEGHTDSGGSQRLVGYVTAGAGLVGVGVGAVTGLMAYDRKQTIVDTCTKNADRYACGPEGVDAAASGNTLATVSTIAMLSGLALTATGVVLVLTSSNDAPALTATLLPGGGFVGGRGRF